MRASTAFGSGVSVFFFLQKMFMSIAPLFISLEANSWPELSRRGHFFLVSFLISYFKSAPCPYLL